MSLRGIRDCAVRRRKKLRCEMRSDCKFGAVDVLQRKIDIKLRERVVLVLSTKIASGGRYIRARASLLRAHSRRRDAFVSSLDRESPSRACGEDRPREEQCEYIKVSGTKTKARHKALKSFTTVLRGEAESRV